MIPSVKKSGKSLSKNIPSPVLWEEIHILGDKPRRKKIPHESRSIKTK